MTTTARELAKRRAGKPLTWQRVLLYISLSLFAIAFLMPVYLLIITGMKSFAEVSLRSMWDLPKGLHFDSYIKAWFGSELEGFRGLNGNFLNSVYGNFLNSVYLTIPATLLSAMWGSINGYILAKWKFRGSNVLFPLLLFGMFIPYQAILIPLVQTLQKINIFGVKFYGSIVGLIFTHVVYSIPITTLIFRNYYANIPTELVEAARIDGANIFSIYRYVLFPECADGRCAADGAAHAAGLPVPGPLLHAGTHGRLPEGMRASRRRYPVHLPP